MPEWTFLTKHGLVLSLIAQNPRITAQELAVKIGVTERAIRRVIRDLSMSGYINKTRVGRGIRYKIVPELPLRHETHREVVIGEFLEMLGWKRRRRRPRATAVPEGKNP